MFTVVAQWMAAAEAAVAAAIPTAHVTTGPMLTFDGLEHTDLVMIGHNDPADADDPAAAAFTFEGQWRDTGAAAVTEGEVRVPVTVYSQSASTDLDMPARITAAGVLHAAVRAALIPSPAGSDLGVSGLLWAHESNVTAHFIHGASGPIVVLVLTFTLATLA